LSPDELLVYQKNAVGDSRYDVLNLVQQYLKEHTDWRVSTKKNTYGALRSFFLHNRAELPRDSSFRIRSEKKPYSGSLTLDEFKMVLASCNRMYRAIFLCMFQGALGIGEWNYWNWNGWSSLKSQLDMDLNPVKIDLPGRKKRKNVVPYYTYVGFDAIKALKDWLPNRSSGVKTIFANQMGTELTEWGLRMYWLRHLERLGLINKLDVKNMGNEKYGIRYEKNPHELRDLFRTRWQKSGRASEVGEFFMGHEIDPLGYNKAMRDERYTRGEYRRATKWLNILSEKPEYIHVDEVDEIKASLKDEILKEVMRTLRLNAEIEKHKAVSFTSPLIKNEFHLNNAKSRQNRGT